MCGSRHLSLILQLEPTPPANAFVTSDALDRPQERFPLDVFFCEECAHVQLLDVIDPHALFEDYVYVSGTSPVFRKHFENYAEDMITLVRPGAGALVVDIGSNDGTLLSFFKRARCRVLGVDPAGDIANEATHAGIETLPVFFTPQLGKEIREELGPAAIVTANNVFAHIDDLCGVLEGVRALLAPEGVFVFEVSYLVDVFEKTLFDTIYHEHLAYHSLTPLLGFFSANGMELIEALRNESHGGTLRGIAQLNGGPRPIGASVAEAVANEKRLGLDRAETFERFAERVETLKLELGSRLRGLKAAGHSIAGFGAPAKATTLMYHFDIGPNVIDYIVDDSPLKQGLYTPGLHIPVLPTEQMYARRPDYMIVLAWNFARPIMEKHAAFRDQGSHFIVPLPNVEIH